MVSGLVAAALIAGAPTAGWALTTLGDGYAAGALPRIGALQLGESVFTPSSVDPAVADLVAQRGTGRGLDRFTPAGSDPHAARRTVTVAVRVDGDGAGRFASVRGGLRGLGGESSEAGALRIAPTRYNLGVARGFQPFAKPAPVLSQTLSDAAIPNLAEFRPSPGVAETESRFAATVAVEDAGRNAPAARPADPRGDQTVNVAGSYRLTRNLNVTAGVRYSQQQHRITPAQDVSHKEGQAVYIGTQFSF